MKRLAQQEAFQGLLTVLNLSCCDNYTLYYTINAIMTAKVTSLSWIWIWHMAKWVVIKKDILDECKVFPNDWWLKICSCHISHKESLEKFFYFLINIQHILPQDWNSCLTALQHKVNNCYYLQPCRADDFYARASRLNISVVFLTEKFFKLSDPTPP